jgi:hypothetical protein
MGGSSPAPEGQPATATAGRQPTGGITGDQGKEGQAARLGLGQGPLQQEPAGEPELQPLETELQQRPSAAQVAAATEAQLQGAQVHGIAEL